MNSQLALRRLHFVDARLTLAVTMIVTTAFAQPTEPAAAPAATAAAPAAADAPPPGPVRHFFGPAMMPEIKLRAKFDKDGNKLLDAAERKAAREYLAANPIQRGPRRPGGRGGPPEGPGGFRGPGGQRETPTPGESLAPADVKRYGDEALFDASALRTLFFTFEDSDWEKQLEEFHNTDVELPATLMVDGKTYPDVGVHFRGASSYMMVGTGSKRSLGVSIDAAREDQNLLGHRTLNLLNAHGDPSLIRAALYSHIAQTYLAAPRVNFVRVVINGENWGIYASAEQFNKDFTQDRFGTAKRARWKVPGSPGGRGSLAYLGESVDAYKPIYDIKSKDDARSWSRLIQLCRALDETPADQLEAALAPLLDVDGALKFLALENALVNSDGYWTRTSDYSIAEDADGRLNIVPHDMNETFGFGGGGGLIFRRGPRGPNQPDTPNETVLERSEGPPVARGEEPGRGASRERGDFVVGPGGPGGPTSGLKLDPLVAANNPNAPLASKLLAVPALRARYLGYMREIAETWLDWSCLGPIAQKYHALIDTDVKRDTRKLTSYDAFVASLETGERSLKSFADQRRAFLLEHPEIKRLPPAAN